MVTWTTTTDEKNAVEAFADGVRVFGWSTGNNAKLAVRLARCIEAGQAFDPRPAGKMIVDGKTIETRAGWDMKILGRYMNADLKRLGF